MKFEFGGPILRSTLACDTQQQKHSLRVRAFLFLTLQFLLAVGLLAEDRAAIVFTQSAAEVAVFDFIEVTAKLPAAAAPNPFTDASLAGDLRVAWLIGILDGDAVGRSCFRLQETPAVSRGRIFSEGYLEKLSGCELQGPSVVVFVGA